MFQRIFYFLFFLFLPLTAHGQILETLIATPEMEVTAQGDAPMNVLCTTTAQIYALASKYESQIDEQNRHRDKQERVTTAIEQHRKLDPKGEHPREPTTNEPYYTAMFTREPTVCALLNGELEKYITEHEASLKHAVSTLILQTQKMNEAEKQAYADKLKVCLDPDQHPTFRVGKKVLYVCIYRTKNVRNVPLTYSVEKTMRRLFAIQEPLLDAWLGNVD